MVSLFKCDHPKLEIFLIGTTVSTINFLLS